MRVWYFVNEKIPEEYRDKIPVIAEAEDVLWIVGYRQSMAYQITDKTNTILAENVKLWHLNAEMGKMSQDDKLVSDEIKAIIG